MKTTAFRIVHEHSLVEMLVCKMLKSEKAGRCHMLTAQDQLWKILLYNEKKPYYIGSIKPRHSAISHFRRDIVIFKLILKGGTDKNLNKRRWVKSNFLGLKNFIFIMFEYFCLASKIKTDVVETKHWLELVRLKIFKGIYKIIEEV